MLRAPGAMPVPCTVAVGAPPGVAEAVKVADCMPAAAGANERVTTQVTPAPMAAPQVLLTTLKTPGGIMPNDGAPEGTSPRLVTLMVAVLAAPFTTEPKSTRFVDS